VRRRRRAVDLEAARRWKERRARIGADARTMRRRRGWTQQLLAGKAGVGRMVVARIEAGAGALDLESLERIGAALGVPVVAGFGRDPHELVADAGHLAMQELVLRLGRAAGFTVAFELPTRPRDPRHSSDAALADDRRHIAIDAECWNLFDDIGAAARSTARKVAELEEIVAHRWADGGRATSVWIVRDTNRNRALVARYPEVFRARFPGSSAGWAHALTGGGEVPLEPGLVWCDLRATRIFAWRAGRAGPVG
jgi:transcriptional regulator with XRE-family HTH domain